MSVPKPHHQPHVLYKFMWLCPSVIIVFVILYLQALFQVCANQETSIERMKPPNQYKLTSNHDLFLQWRQVSYTPEHPNPCQDDPLSSWILTPDILDGENLYSAVLNKSPEIQRHVLGSPTRVDRMTVRVILRTKLFKHYKRCYF